MCVLLYIQVQYIHIYNLHIANFKQISNTAIPIDVKSYKKKKIRKCRVLCKTILQKKNVFASSGQSMIVCKIAIPGNG